MDVLVLVDATVAVAAMAIVSVFALAQEWDLSSWVRAAAIYAGTGIFSFLIQIRRNRQLDSAARQAHEFSNGLDPVKTQR